MAFGAFVVATALLALAPPEQSQAQLYIDINPLQGDANRTVWTFSGSSTAITNNSIQIATGNLDRTSGGTVLPYNHPSGSPLIPTGNLPSNWNNYVLTATADSPQITTSGGTRTISHIFLQNFTNVVGDFVGIRVSGSSRLSYINQSSVSWSGRGILPYSITNLTTTASGQYFYNYSSGPSFAARTPPGNQNTPSMSGLRVRVSSTPVVPEPQEYALIFALFALAFVIFRPAIGKRNRTAKQVSANSQSAIGGRRTGARFIVRKRKAIATSKD